MVMRLLLTDRSKLLRRALAIAIQVRRCCVGCSVLGFGCLNSAAPVPFDSARHFPVEFARLLQVFCTAFDGGTRSLCFRRFSPGFAFADQYIYKPSNGMKTSLDIRVNLGTEAHRKRLGRSSCIITLKNLGYTLISVPIPAHVLAAAKNIDEIWFYMLFFRIYTYVSSMNCLFSPSWTIYFCLIWLNIP